MMFGAVIATAGSAFADQIKSLVGKTVVGEYTVKVNGDALTESAIVVDGKAHVPLRAVSDSLGADIAVNGKTVEISTEKAVDMPAQTGNNDDQAKSSTGYALENNENLPDDGYTNFLETMISQAENQKVNIQKSIDELNKRLNEYPELYDSRLAAIEKKKAEIEEVNKQIEEYKEKIADIKASLIDFNN
jgi:hypothetical protein